MVQFRPASGADRPKELEEIALMPLFCSRSLKRNSIALLAMLLLVAASGINARMAAAQSGTPNALPIAAGPAQPDMVAGVTQLPASVASLPAPVAIGTTPPGPSAALAPPPSIVSPYLDTTRVTPFGDMATRQSSPTIVAGLPILSGTSLPTAAPEPIWTPQPAPAVNPAVGPQPVSVASAVLGPDVPPGVVRAAALAQKPLYDPEQPGNLDKYLEQVEGRLGRLEKFASTPPKLPFIQLTGFFQLDQGFFSQSDGSKDDLGNIQNGIGFRRTRLAAVGKVSDFTGYSLEVDFATAGRPSFFDTWGEQQNLPVLGTIRIGQFRQPTTMDAWTSVRHLEFMERSLPFQALDPFRRVGVMAYNMSDSQRTTWAYSVFGTGFTFWNPNFAGGANTQFGDIGDSRFAEQLGDNGSVSGAIRATHLLYYDEPSEGRYLLHAGGGFTGGSIGGSGPFAHTFISQPLPEFFVGDASGGGATAAGTPPVVSTGRILASSYQYYHTELAANAGAASCQSEFLFYVLDQLGGPPIYLPGAYAQCGYFLTGESAAYNKQAGVLDYNVVPYSDFFGLGKGKGFGGWGAWQVAARWSYLDLDCANLLPANQQIVANGTAPQNPNYGSVNESTVGINWWWNRYTRLQFNWIHSMPVYRNNVALPGTPNAVVFNGSAPFDIYGMRFQVEF
jgi:phosphate-selective porin OprO/OprP